MRIPPSHLHCIALSPLVCTSMTGSHIPVPPQPRKDTRLVPQELEMDGTRPLTLTVTHALPTYPTYLLPTSSTYLGTYFNTLQLEACNYDDRRLYRRTP